jgi:hypothetical protein
LVFGNPPFGKRNSLAIKFFNHSAKYADVIAFIIPMSFRRDLYINRLDKNFNLISDLTLPTKSFIPHIKIKCCFQVWKRMPNKRLHIHKPILTNNDFIIYNNKQKNTLNADFCVQQRGTNVGRIIFPTDKIYNDKKKYNCGYLFIKSNIDISILLDRINNIDLTKTRDVTTIENLSKSLFITEYDKIKNKNILKWTFNNL